MIIEDDPTSRDMMKTMLDKAGWKTSTAENGRVGLERIEEQQPDLILLDLMMPEMDGFEFVARLRQIEKWRKIPVIVLTAKDITHEDRVKLNLYTQMIFQKGAYKKDKLLLEIKELLEHNTLLNSERG
jgi:CheY-like chemotaxis protein